jgi:hypothetical protein
MRNARLLVLILFLVPCGSGVADASSILFNGNLDLTVATEIVDGFFLPKPQGWVNEGFRSITGPYEDEMSSEPWAGPAPTPVTTDGNANPPPPDGCGGPDCAVFFKPFSGNAVDGSATGHLYQDNSATPGVTYTLTGWAGAEANFLGGAEFALEFLNAGGGVLSSTVLDLLAAGLLVDNGEAFDYKQYSIVAIAPLGTATVRVRASMINGMSNPQGGGQAFVVDDFELADSTTAVPEPASFLLTLSGLIGLAEKRRRARARR